ncbi:AMP-binding protein [Dactylosporangium sp. CS-033363]|uniref:AMP-binding protein n=1 Tax=Dactylosporangium sp. CS-033363 TaxID=3239935 RepID=UPI003D91B42F
MSAVLSLLSSHISDKTAITGDDRSVSYASLWRAASRLSFRRGERVLYRGRNRTEFWELLLACLRCGATLVPVNFRLSDAEAAWIAEDAGIGRVHDDAPVMIMYSSGTTGRPKGVIIDDEQLAWTVGAFGALFEVDEHAVSLVPTPYHHIAGTGWSLITLAAGGTIVQNADPTPESMFRQLVDHRVTHAAMVPTLIQAISDRRAGLPALRHIVYGGAPITPALMTRATEVFGAQFHQSYGLTETTGVATVLDPGEHRPDGRLTSVGRPLPGLEVKVSAIGEILVRGPAVTRGYWGNADATSESIVDGWLHTGDAGAFDGGGYLYLRDRIKDMIVSGGENVYPAEVEQVLAAHPHVLDVAVIGVPSSRWGESPLAVVVADGPVDDLIPWSRERLAHFKCPVAVHEVEALPRNASGKVLKRLLRESYGAST